MLKSYKRYKKKNNFYGKKSLHEKVLDLAKDRRTLHLLDRFTSRTWQELVDYESNYFIEEKEEAIKTEKTRLNKILKEKLNYLFNERKYLYQQTKSLFLSRFVCELLLKKLNENIHSEINFLKNQEEQIETNRLLELPIVKNNMPTILSNAKKGINKFVIDGTTFETTTKE